jgi:hypothetical protein
MWFSIVRCETRNGNRGPSSTSVLRLTLHAHHTRSILAALLRTPFLLAEASPCRVDAHRTDAKLDPGLRRGDAFRQIDSQAICRSATHEAGGKAAVSRSTNAAAARPPDHAKAWRRRLMPAQPA